MAVDLETLKTSLRLDGNADDALLTGYQSAAESYVKNAVGTDDGKFYAQDAVSPLYDVAVIALASGYYTFRTALSLVESYPIDLPTNSIIGQLRGLYADYLAEQGAFDGDQSTGVQ